MKVRKRINYYHNRHRSDGALIENQKKRIENQEELLILSEPEEKKTLNQKYKKNNNYYNSSININKDNKNDNNLTEENIKNTSIKYINNSNNNNYNHIFPKEENYLNREYSQASDKLTKTLTLFYDNLKKSIPDFSKKNKSGEITDKQLDEQNLYLINENAQLEKEISLLQQNIKNYDHDLNIMEEPTLSDIEQLYNINQNLMRENENLKQMINKIKINRDSDKTITNSLKYKADFLVQNMVGSMKELISIFENDLNVNSNINTNMTIDNKSFNLPTVNLENFTQSSFSQENNLSKEQYTLFNSDLNNNINNFIYNDSSRNYKDREINFHSKY